jgi:hypothetical protein
MTDPSNGHTGREYVILQANPDDGNLQRLPNVVAAGALQAARRAAHDLDARQGIELIAVPARNWTVIKLHLQRSERLVTE